MIRKEPGGHAVRVLLQSQSMRIPEKSVRSMAGSHRGRSTRPNHASTVGKRHRERTFRANPLRRRVVGSATYSKQYSKLSCVIADWLNFLMKLSGLRTNPSKRACPLDTAYAKAS